MKKSLLTVMVALAAMLITAASLPAQTAGEIVNKMSETMDRSEAEGYTMDFIMKMPIIGTMNSHNQIRGNKSKSVIGGAEGESIVWTDATTTWTYDPKKGEITIDAKKEGESTQSGDSEMSQFDNLEDGYDLSIQKETADAWYIVCKKSRNNKEKDDPKRIDLAVAKATYLPIYLRTSVSVVSISIENFKLGVSEESVTFRPEDYPGATVIDKRQ